MNTVLFTSFLILVFSVVFILIYFPSSDTSSISLYQNDFGPVLAATWCLTVDQGECLPKHTEHIPYPWAEKCPSGSQMECKKHPFCGYTKYTNDICSQYCYLNTSNQDGAIRQKYTGEDKILFTWTEVFAPVILFCTFIGVMVILMMAEYDNKEKRIRESNEKEILEHIREEDVINLWIIGTGTFCDVSLSKYKNKCVIVKTFIDKNVRSKDVLNEAKICWKMAQLDITPLVIGLVVQSKSPLHYSSIVFEHFEPSLNLEELLETINRYTIAGIANVISQVAHLVNRMHIAGYMHNDIKTDNVLVSPVSRLPRSRLPTNGVPTNKFLRRAWRWLASGPVNVHSNALNNNVAYRVWLIDFGSASFITGRRYNLEKRKHSGLSVFSHYAPEVFRKESTTFKSDTYSFGYMIKYIATTLHDPALDALFKDLTTYCCSLDPDERPTMSQVAKTLFSVEEKLTTLTTFVCGGKLQ